jgi:hypothetical protein
MGCFIYIFISVSLAEDILTSASQFISSRGNEYFCEIDEEYLTDRFNLTGLNTEVQYYQYALDLVTDVFDLDCDDDMRETIEKSARHLYGLVHARYIVTTRGLAKMVCTSLFFSGEINISSAREIQKERLWQMSPRHVQVTGPSPHGPVRQPQPQSR